MSAIPATYLSIINPLIGMAREIMEGGESLAPFAFVGNLKTKETFPVMLHTGTEEQKDDSARMIRQIAHRMEADFVFVTMEAWSLRSDKLHQAVEILDRYGSIGASPYRIDVVSFTLETRYGMWLAQIPVRPKGASKKQRTFDAPKFRHFTVAEGRFVDLLPIKDKDQTPPGTLH